MVVSVSIASPFRKYTGGLGKVEVEAKDVKELIDLLEKRFPGLRASLLDEEGRILPHLNIYVNERDVETLGGLASPLGPGDEVAIVPAIAGGCFTQATPRAPGSRICTAFEDFSWDGAVQGEKGGKRLRES